MIDVLAFDRHAVNGVERVRQAQAGDVVIERERPRVAAAPAFGPQARQGRLQRRRAEQRHARDVVRGRQVLLHQHRRQRQHVGDVVEPVAGVVLREVVGGTHLDAEQIANRVVVFVAVETAGGHTTRIRRRHAVDAGELTLEPGGNRLALRFLGLLFLERRHLAAPQHADDVFPMIALADQRLRRLERLEVQAVLGFALVAVAAEAVFGEKWPNRPCKTPDARVVDDRRGRVRRHKAAGGGDPAHGERRRGGRFRAREFLRTQRHSDSGETTNRDEEQ